MPLLGSVDRLMSPMSNPFSTEPKSRIGNVLVYDMPEDFSIDVHESVGGTNLQKLADRDYSLSSLEFPVYSDLIRQHLRGVNKHSPVLDAGCGDGRFALELAQDGFTNIVALDSNLESLIRLEGKLQRLGLADSVTLVRASVAHPPVRRSHFRVVLAIGVLYYLNEGFESAHKLISECLQPGGLLIETEPDKAGCATKALLFDGFHEFERVVTQDRFLEYFGKTAAHFRCFSTSEILEFFESRGLELIASAPIPLFPSLFVIAQKRYPAHLSIEGPQSAAALRELFRKLQEPGAPAKHRLWVTRLTRGPSVGKSDG